MKALSKITAGDIMTREVFTLNQDQTVKEAAAQLLGRGVQGAPVVDDRGNLVGVLSVTDLARFEEERSTEIVTDSDYFYLLDRAEERRMEAAEGFQLESFDDTRVVMLMTPSVVSVIESDPLETVLHTMLDLEVHRIIVADNHGRKLVGVITQSDILRRAVLPIVERGSL